MMYYCSFAAPRYIPDCIVGKTEITVEEVKKLNKLNDELAVALSLRHQAFTSFQHGNFTCIHLTTVRYFYIVNHHHHHSAIHVGFVLCKQYGFLIIWMVSIITAWGV